MLTLVAGTACDARLGHRQDQPISARIEVPPGTSRVLVDVHRGALTIRAGEPGVVEFAADARLAADTEEGLNALRAVDLQPAVAHDEGTLSVRAPRVPEGLDPVAHQLITKTVVRVPPDVSVEARTNFGAMAGFNHRGSLVLESGRGAMHLDRCVGDVALRTVDGDVMVEAHRGGLDIEVRAASPRDRDKSAAVPSGVGRTMQVFVAELGASGVRLFTEHGGIQAHVPAEASFELDAKTEVGRARNSFGIEAVPIPGTTHGLSMRGRVGEGGPRVELHAEVGNVSVRAQDPK